MALFYNFGLVDVLKKEYIENSYMIIEANYIKFIGDQAELSDYQLQKGIDLKGQTVMPGLFNLHIHALSTPIARPATLNVEDPSKFGIRGSVHLQQYLKSGVTFVRDMNGRKKAETGLKEAIRDNIVLGPEYYICGQALTMTGGHGSNTGQECDGIDGCRKAAREQLKRGVDFIKLIATGGVMSPGDNEHETQLDEEEMAAAIKEAHKVGKKTAAHAHGAEGIKNAIKAGIDSIEHGSYLDDEGIELMLKNNTALVPTLSVDYFLFRHGRQDVPQYAIDKAKRAEEAQIKSFLKAWEAGVMIGIGTDAGTPYNPHYGTYQEFVSMVDLGIKEIDVISAGTITSAKIAGVEKEQGSIEPGKLANFIVLKENPIQDIRALKNINMVYLKGNLVEIGNVEYLPHLD
ncbi:metal-dependent hydrolase family protein [Virgibacillus halodenitrificans]|uniref:metal-dependent hydrolase family protein n=1 Tax=Virgibacillus halodenitrificans TaxID=1482 RepID=UPI00045D4B0B|nr:amidohydrolase family protein [Virgibacillus halodenitrificans]CDQ32070.1 imidazolonepropionase [Virgibacillus halodenitrificans]